MAMKIGWAAVLGVACVAMWLAAAAPQRTSGWVHEYPTPMTREEAAVSVNGVEEIWALRWKDPPRPQCADWSLAITCPCQGFGYGEAGDLELVRMRGRIVFDRLHLAGVVESGWGKKVGFIVQRSPVRESDSDDTSTEEVRERPVVRAMEFADYDHDGIATEFYLQTDALPCGKSFGVVAGISAGNPRLHVFGTASNPDKPLYLQKEEWVALREATSPVEIMDWECSDHGADRRTVLRLTWTAKGIDGTRRYLSCPDGKLISEAPL